MTGRRLRPRRPRYALWGHRRGDWTPGREPILTVTNSPFWPRGPVLVSVGRERRPAWVLIDHPRAGSGITS